MPRRSLVFMLLLAVLPVALLPSRAAADCSGPTILRIAPAIRGDVITVHGTAFGDNCYDTGPPPAGQGALGVPVSDVELLVSQADHEILVASGDADDRYEFTVDIRVPPDLAPGPAWLVARWRSDRSTARAFDVLSDPPMTDPPETTPIVPIGSVPASTDGTVFSSVTAETVVRFVDDEQGLSGALVGGALSVVLVASIAALWWTRRSRAA